jgi:hypothetical protein
LLQKHLVRLACIRHAASVHPEPGSNSPQKIFHSCECSLYGIFTGSTELLLPITVQLLKFGVQSGLDFTSATSACQGFYRQKHRCLLSFDIGSSDCKTRRLVSLTGDSYSVFMDLSGGRDLFRMYWRMIIICIRLDLSRAYQTIYLKKSGFLFLHMQVFVDLNIRIVLRSVIICFRFELSRGYQTIYLKKSCSFFADEGRYIEPHRCPFLSGTAR